MRRQFALSGLAATLAIALLATLGAITTSTTAASSDTIASVVGSSTVPLLPSFEESTLPSSPLTIVKTADTSSAAFGDDIRFTLYLHNEASESVPALVFDPIADGTRYVPDSFEAEPSGALNGYDEETNAIFWQGEVEGGAEVKITYAVRVVRCDPAGFQVHNVVAAHAYGQGVLPVTAEVTVQIKSCIGPDLGDAPDSSNHSDTAMKAYPGVVAEFPTVFDPHAGAPPGPRHRNAAAVHLGRGASFERDADLPPDQDGVTNLLLIPYDEIDVEDIASLSGLANLDGFDDGVRPPPIEPCQAWVDLPVAITVDDPGIPELDGLLYLNIWVDGNHDGDWGDINTCNGEEAPEWVLQDFTIPMSNLILGTNVITVPTTLPVYREETESGVLPAWMRVTLSESAAPHAADAVPADGRGPEDGWNLGETEDYYLPGTRPPVAIDKTADKSEAVLGEEIEYTVILSNLTTDSAKVFMYDPIPDGAQYVEDSFSSSLPGVILEGYSEPLNAILWLGFVPGNTTVEIKFRVQVVRCRRDGFPLLNTAWVYDYNVQRAAATSVRVLVLPCTGPDLGDAPDTTNHFGAAMTAYPGVQAEFPTVFDANTGVPSGPLHHDAFSVHLGRGVSAERDADQTPDQDGRPNLRPPADTPNLDDFDDAFPEGLPRTASCESWTGPIAITVNEPGLLASEMPLYLNIWVDGNHNGAWGDTNVCGDFSVEEWVLQNHVITTTNLVTGSNSVTVTTLPIYREASDHGLLPAWLRITLSDTPAENLDGSGPESGWEMGETEDHYLPGDPAIGIDKTADKTAVAAGDEIEFTVTLSNASAQPTRAMMYDLIPPGTEYVPHSYSSTVAATEEGYDMGPTPEGSTGRHWIYWRGDVPGHGTVVIKFRVRVVRCASDGFRVINDAWAIEPGLPAKIATAEVRVEPCRMTDLGDAPDSSNHSTGVTMTAYAGVEAHFPTVFQPSSDPAIEPPGPMHRRPHAGTWLGEGISGEQDADLLPDQDGATNLDPPHDKADRDRYDDGLILPVATDAVNATPFPHCQGTEIKVVVTAAPNPTGVTPIRERYVNVWFDWNRDGDWEDAFDCETDEGNVVAVLEWAVRDYVAALGPGMHVIKLPAFLPYNPTPEKPLWARVTLSDEPAPVNPDSGLADGRGPDEGYDDGETEDYLIPGRRKVTILKRVDKRHVDLGGTLAYTLTVSNSGSLPVLNARAEDEIPEHTAYISGTLKASKGEAAFEEHTVTWDGDIEAGETVTISFQVRVGLANAAEAESEAICGNAVRNRAVLRLANGEAHDSNTIISHILCPDLGDAPDSTNHFNVRMTAYGVVTATFPTIFSHPANQPSPPGPVHWEPRADAWLGHWVSGERDADLMPDEDGQPNLDPSHDRADQDRADDGLVLPVRLPHCQQTEITVRVTVPGATTAPGANATRDRYINAWFDWNRDGDWEDVLECTDEAGNVAETPEWAVRDYAVTLTPGLHEVALPAFRPYNPTPHLPVWARVTLAEEPAPLNPDSSLADGRGPDTGYKYGETEDYLIPGVQVEPEVKIVKRVDKLHAGLGEELAYTLFVENGGLDPVTGAHVEDEIPEGTTYVPDSLWASKPVTGFTGSAVTWDGDIGPGELVEIHFRVRIKAEPDPEAADDERCGRSVENRAVLVLSNGITLTSNEVHTRVVCPDLGDAPDSTNYHGAAMTAYPSGVPANFPTVFSHPATQPSPPGPIHWQPTQDAWLGPRDAPPTGERDADRMPDQDGRPNIDPPADKANQDEHDNGVFRDTLNLQHCEPATFKYLVTIVGSQRERYVNVWFDWNRDGDWEDMLDCPDGPAPEWAVQNQVISLGPGTYVITSTAFLPWHPDPDDPMWMRITLAERPVGVALATAAGDVIPTDGSGPTAGYKYGETEGYLLGEVVSPEPPDVWVQKELRFVDFDEEAVEPAKPPPARFFFQIEYGNKGGKAAENAVITDTLPMSTTYKGSRSWPDIEPPTVVTPTVSWQAGTLYPGDHGVINLWFHVPADEFQVLPPGTVLTNTVVIATTTPGDDPSNNTGVVTGTIPLLPPRITWPIPGTTHHSAITVTGKSQIGTFVDLYADGVYTATTTVDSQGNWDVPLTLPDGTHSLYAKARTVMGDESGPSNQVVIVVNTSLVWDPMSMTFTTVAPSGDVWTQHIRDQNGRADPTGWSVHLPQGITATVAVHIRCATSPTVTLTVSNTTNTLTSAGDGWYRRVITTPGKSTASMSLTATCGNTTDSGSGSGLIDPDGYVYDVDVGKTAGTLEGLTVTALEHDAATSSWDRWPAELYENQINPQVTGADGYYSFYTPPGDYRITVDASTAYQGYRSWTLTVISTPVHLDIPLTPAYTETHYAVTVDSAGFVPDTLEVVQGSVVEWKNNEVTSGVWHSATSDLDARTDTSGWDSGLLDSGETYSRRFDSLGTFTYYDYENPSLKGTIKVCYLYDFDCDSKVGVSDLQGVAQRWRAASGQGNGYEARYDVDGDGQINIVDIQKAAMQWNWTAP